MNVYIVKILPEDKTLYKDILEEWLVIMQEHVIHTGSIFTNIDEFIQGLVMGLELANLNPETVVWNVKNTEEYNRVSRGDISLERIQNLIES